jgi:hypothetical protein
MFSYIVQSQKLSLTLASNKVISVTISKWVKWDPGPSWSQGIQWPVWPTWPTGATGATWATWPQWPAWTTDYNLLSNKPDLTLLQNNKVILSINTNTTLPGNANTDYLVFVSWTTNVTFPTAIWNNSRYTIIHTDTNAMTLLTTASQTIAFYPQAPSTSAIVTVQWVSLDIASDNANWRVI